MSGLRLFALRSLCRLDTDVGDAGFERGPIMMTMMAAACEAGDEAAHEAGSEEEGQESVSHVGTFLLKSESLNGDEEWKWQNCRLQQA